MGEPKDVREMRQHIVRAVRGRERVDGKDTDRTQIAPTGAILNAIFRTAEREGWSGEDTMTALAYYALVRAEDLHDRIIEFVNITPYRNTLTVERGEK